MYIAMHKKVEHFCNASKITNVLRNCRIESMKDILAKLCKTLRNPFTRDEMRQHMQALLHEFTLAKDKKDLEQPRSGTPHSFSWK